MGAVLARVVKKVLLETGPFKQRDVAGIQVRGQGLLLS